jgi:hypothetical protein
LEDLESEASAWASWWGGVGIPGITGEGGGLGNLNGSFNGKSSINCGLSIELNLKASAAAHASPSSCFILDSTQKGEKSKSLSSSGSLTSIHVDCRIGLHESPI